jgi:hypothetical protein
MAFSTHHTTSPSMRFPAEYRGFESLRYTMRQNGALKQIFLFLT